jgi:hypothetical protein
LLAAFSQGGDLFGNARERRVPLHPVNAHSIARGKYPVNPWIDCTYGMYGNVQ